MKIDRLILGIIVIVTLLVTGISFFVLKNVTKKSIKNSTIDKAEPLYLKAEEFLKKNEPERAINAFSAVINRYQDSSFAEGSIRKLISIYQEKGDKDKVRYYYSELLEKFPNTKPFGTCLAIIII